MPRRPVRTWKCEPSRGHRYERSRNETVRFERSESGIRSFSRVNSVFGLELLKNSCVESAIQATNIVNCVHRIEIRSVFCIATELSARQEIRCCLSTGVSLNFKSAPLRLIYREVTGLFTDRLENTNISAPYLITTRSRSPAAAVYDLSSST